MFSNRIFVCLFASCVVAIFFTGCRNRCSQQCGNPFQQQQLFPQPFQQQPFQNQQFQQQPFQQQPFQNQFGFNPAANGQANTGARSPVIAPPATGSLNIPSLARNNPFGINGGLLSTGQRAPTPANNTSSQFNRQNGWQPVGGTSSAPPTFPQNNTQSNTQSNTGTTLGSTSRTAAPTAPAAARSVLAQGSQTRPAGYGDSYIRSPNYSTTAVNETNDGTRLPATDASGVRAPSQYYARVSGAQVASLPAQGTFAAPQQLYSSGTFGGTNPALFNPAQGTTQPVLVANSGAYVQGQSTATYDPYGDTRSADWRNRDISSGTFQ